MRDYGHFIQTIVCYCSVNVWGPHRIASFVLVLFWLCALICFQTINLLFFLQSLKISKPPSKISATPSSLELSDTSLCDCPKEITIMWSKIFNFIKIKLIIKNISRNSSNYSYNKISIHNQRFNLISYNWCDNIFFHCKCHHTILLALKTTWINNIIFAKLIIIKENRTYEQHIIFIKKQKILESLNF